MINLLKAFRQIWTYPLNSREEAEQMKIATYLGKSEIGVAEFFKSLEVITKYKKYSFK